MSPAFFSAPQSRTDSWSSAPTCLGFLRASAMEGMVNQVDWQKRTGGSPRFCQPSDGFDYGKLARALIHALVGQKDGPAGGEKVI